MPLVHFYGNCFEIPQLKESQNLKQWFGGDIQKFPSKLSGFVWSRYPGEYTFQAIITLAQALVLILD